MRALVLIAALIAAPWAGAVNFSADIAWTLPAVDVAGNPLTGPATLTEIRLYSATDLNATNFTDPDAPHATLPPSLTRFQHSQTDAVPGTTFYTALRACNTAGCSALSQMASKVIPPLAPPPVGIPTPPSSLTIQIAALIESLQNFLAAVKVAQSGIP